jgi:hypothetical protein
VATKAIRHAGQLRELVVALEREPAGRDYILALQEGTASLLNDARNHRHVAKVLRESKPAAFGTATLERAHGADS